MVASDSESIVPQSPNVPASDTDFQSRPPTSAQSPTVQTSDKTVPVTVKCISTGEERTYMSLRGAAEALGINPGTLCRALQPKPGSLGRSSVIGDFEVSRAPPGQASVSPTVFEDRPKSSNRQTVSRKQTQAKSPPTARALTAATTRRLQAQQNAAVAAAAAVDIYSSKIGRSTFSLSNDASLTPGNSSTNRRGLQQQQSQNTMSNGSILPHNMISGLNHHHHSNGLISGVNSANAMNSSSFNSNGSSRWANYDQLTEMHVATSQPPGRGPNSRVHSPNVQPITSNVNISSNGINGGSMNSHHHHHNLAHLGTNTKNPHQAFDLTNLVTSMDVEVPDQKEMFPSPHDRPCPDPAHSSLNNIVYHHHMASSSNNIIRANTANSTNSNGSQSNMAGSPVFALPSALISNSPHGSKSSPLHGVLSATSTIAFNTAPGMVDNLLPLNRQFSDNNNQVNNNNNNIHNSVNGVDNHAPDNNLIGFSVGNNGHSNFNSTSHESSANNNLSDTMYNNTTTQSFQNSLFSQAHSSGAPTLSSISNMNNNSSNSTVTNPHLSLHDNNNNHSADPSSQPTLNMSINTSRLNFLSSSSSGNHLPQQRPTSTGHTASSGTALSNSSLSINQPSSTPLQLPRPLHNGAVSPMLHQVDSTPRNHQPLSSMPNSLSLGANFSSSPLLSAVFSGAGATSSTINGGDRDGGLSGTPLPLPRHQATSSPLVIPGLPPFRLAPSASNTPRNGCGSGGFSLAVQTPTNGLMMMMMMQNHSQGHHHSGTHNNHLTSHNTNTHNTHHHSNNHNSLINSSNDLFSAGNRSVGGPNNSYSSHWNGQQQHTSSSLLAAAAAGGISPCNGISGVGLNGLLLMPHSDATPTNSDIVNNLIHMNSYNTNNMNNSSSATTINPGSLHRVSSQEGTTGSTTAVTSQTACHSNNNDNQNFSESAILKSFGQLAAQTTATSSSNNNNSHSDQLLQEAAIAAAQVVEASIINNNNVHYSSNQFPFPTSTFQSTISSSNQMNHNTLRPNTSTLPMYSKGTASAIGPLRHPMIVSNSFSPPNNLNSGSRAGVSTVHPFNVSTNGPFDIPANGNNNINSASTSEVGVSLIIGATAGNASSTSIQPQNNNINSKNGSNPIINNNNNVSTGVAYGGMLNNNIKANSSSRNDLPSQLVAAAAEAAITAATMASRSGQNSLTSIVNGNEFNDASILHMQQVKRPRPTSSLSDNILASGPTQGGVSVSTTPASTLHYPISGGFSSGSVNSNFDIDSPSKMMRHLVSSTGNTTTTGIDTYLPPAMTNTLNILQQQQLPQQQQSTKASHTFGSYPSAVVSLGGAVANSSSGFVVSGVIPAVASSAPPIVLGTYSTSSGGR